MDIERPAPQEAAPPAAVFPQAPPPGGSEVYQPVRFYSPPVYVRKPRAPNAKGTGVGLGMLFIGIFFLFTNVFAIVYATFLASDFFSHYYTKTVDSFQFALERFLLELERVTPSISAIGGAICLVAFVLVHLRMRKKFPNDTVRPRSGPGVMAVVCCTAAGFNLALTTLLTILLNDSADTGPQFGEMWMTLLAVGIVAPFVEEYCFRLLAFNSFRRGMRFWPANFLQAGLFGLAHMNVLQSVYAFALGLFLGWIYERTRSIWAPILTHLVFNCTSIALSYFFYEVDVSIYLLLYTTAIVSAFGIIVLKMLTNTKKVTVPAPPAENPNLPPPS